VADVHWGKAAAFRSAGIPIPGGATRRDLDRLDAAIVRTGARRLVVLGDLFHARAGRVATRTLADLRRWRGAREALEIQLVRGNHDRHAGDPPADLRINSLDAPAFLPPFVLRHEPRVSDAGYTLAGHVHPGIVLAGRGLFRERLPCFVVAERMAVLPAFGSFTGLGMVTPEEGARVFVVAEDEVVEVG
jgi:DNA ligase-associated metallophosphoesterase